ncbi:MAG: hypothetical protein HYV09_15600 [Deltaproteobacteria bacterium]|nr:hypothetical protein [Deltaproteobacteria bacterium]
MAKTDRAFRALARASPRSILALLRLVVPHLVRVEDDDVVALDDPHLDVPPHPREADWVAAAGARDIFHVEGQGYRDGDFADRVFAYHLTLALRHPDRHVRTYAVWMHRPARDQRLATVRRGGTAIRVTTIVLAELRASLLLSRPETAAFAMAAELDGMSVDELCDRVVRALARPGAHPQERAMAGVAAVLRGRYDALMRAMERANMEPVIIEDLVDYGYDLGLEKGLEQGLEQGRVSEAISALLVVLSARSLPVSPTLEAQVRACTDAAVLLAWLRRAAVARSIDEVFGAE